MKTSVIDVRDLLSVLSVDAVEKRIGEVPGVESVTVNNAARNATVRFDETHIEIGDIKRHGGYRSEGEAPRSEHSLAHERAAAPTVKAESPPVPADVVRKPPSAGGLMAATPSSTASKPMTDTHTAAPASAVRSTPARAEPASEDHKEPATPRALASPSGGMAKEMGHGGTDLPTMVRDTRNRFWICLFFTVPIFVYAPMGGLFQAPAPPFGMELNLWLFSSQALRSSIQAGRSSSPRFVR